MPVTKKYQVRYFCNTDAAYFQEEQTTTVALPAQCPNGHLTAVLRDLVVLKETMEIT